MRRNNRHHRRSRKFGSANEYSLYRNRIYLLNALRVAQQNRAVRKELLNWFRRYEEELEIIAPFLMQEYNKAIKGQTTEDPAQRKAAETRFIDSLVKTLKQKTREAPPPDAAQKATHLVIQRFSLTPMAGALLQLTYYFYHYIAQNLWRQLQDLILLYGPPGTGKTEFARTLCGEIGAQLYAIGHGPDARPSADRTKTLDYALEALSDEPNAVILFDEMEDFHQREKLYLNRIVEENPVPIIWACNAITT